MSDVDMAPANVELQSADETDWYLQRLIKIVNNTGIEFPITLYVNGLIVSGQMVGGHRYFDGLADQFREFFGDTEATEETVSMLTSAREYYLGEDVKNDPALPQYVHMRAAKVFVPGQNPIPKDGSWWRGRITSVNGFNFGSMAVC